MGVNRVVVTDNSWETAELRGLRPDQADRFGLGSGGLDQGLRVLSMLLSGLIVYGGLGWLGDYVFHTGFLLPIGLVVGAACGVCAVIFKFGRVTDDQGKDGR